MTVLSEGTQQADGPAARGAGILLTLSLLGFAAGPAFATDMFGAGYKPCGDKASTMEIVSCTDAKTRTWDARLNTAYAALQRSVEPDRREMLRAAQRVWIQYRDANCGFHGAQGGSLGQVQAAECIRAMTQDRATELEQAGKP